MSNIYVLKKYYTKYLKKISNSSPLTITHYLGALDFISTYLSEKEKIKNTIYEITDLNDLQIIREYLYQDYTFMDKDERGHRMYSAGLNNYCRFALGENFAAIQDRIPLMDITVPRNGREIHSVEEFKRSSILKNQTIESAQYLCEIDTQHHTFISASTKRPYMEGHQAMLN